jgi:hypothetical protein
LDADAWFRTIESKFALLTIPCADSNKAHFAAQQLRGTARIWWDNYCAMQTDGHVISWEEFRNAFRAHHIPEGLMERKLTEFLALTQGTRTVLQYAQAFNHLCQYAGYHADNDAKKQDRFRRGLNTKLKEHLNLIKANTFSELVNMALTQVDCITAHRAEKKQRISTGPAGVQPSRYQFVQNRCQEHPNGMFHLVDWFSSRFNNQKSINLLYLYNNHNNWAHGQMFNKSITVSIAEVRIISSEIVRSPRNLIEDRVPVKMTGTRARGR